MRTSLVSFSLSILLLAIVHRSSAQCDSIYQETDPFDSTLVIATPPINIGYLVPSNFQTLEGFKLVEDGKIHLAYASNDSIGSLFLTVAMAERNFQTISSGKTRVMILTDSNRVEALLNVPDRGTFDANTNMRVYQHTCVLPLDIFYLLAADPIQQIRVYYDGGYKHTITLTPRQKEELVQLVKCLGLAAGIFPKTP